MLQSDFSYMIGNDMFRTFVSWELNATARQIQHAYYHLDGEGELAHRDTLLDIKALQGIQWILGEGASKDKDWSDVYTKISKAGKKIQAHYDLDTHLDKILKVIDKPDYLIKAQIYYNINQKKKIKSKLRKYDVYK